VVRFHCTDYLLTTKPNYYKGEVNMNAMKLRITKNDMIAHAIFKRFLDIVY
jgi:hypothetical protein